MSARAPTSSLAAPTSIAVCVSWPQACIDPSTARAEVEPGVLVQRQGVHVAAQQHGRARLAARRAGRRSAGGLVQRDVERQAVERLEHGLPGDRQLVADLGPLVQRATQLDHVVEQVVGSVAQRVERMAEVDAGPMRGDASVLEDPETNWSTSSTTTTT